VPETQYNRGTLQIPAQSRISFIAELASGGFSVELPVDAGAVTSRLAIPGFYFAAESLQIGDSPGPDALPRQDADFDLSLVEPTAVRRRVVDG
jgi:hypothetical protein